jgi:CO/xanthine dehydrogenase Mo-binding subunit
MEQTKQFRMDAIDKVTGKAKFSNDFYFMNMLYAKVVWPDIPYGMVKKIETHEAEQQPGVVKVITRKDITGPNLSGIFTVFDRPVLIGENEIIRYESDPIAIVVAKSEQEALHAAKMIRVTYEEWPHSKTVEEAIKNGDEPFYENTLVKGDIEKGLSEADVTVTRTYQFPLGEHAYIEPEAGVVYRDAQNVINIIVGSQDLTQNQRMICRSLDLPFHKVKLRTPYVGGAFGGKHAMSVQVYLALIGSLIEQPVKLAWTRRESIIHSCKKQGFKVEVTVGAKKDGTLCALQADLVGPCGPYHGNTPDNCNGVLGNMVGPYMQPNVHIHGAMYNILAPELGAFRGVGSPDGLFIIETMMNLVARELGISPYEIRKKNWLKKPEDFLKYMPGNKLRCGSKTWKIEEVLNTALERAGELGEPSSPNAVRGRGFAAVSAAYMTGNTGWHKGSLAQIDMFLDGTILIKTGFAELGQGLTGIMTKIASESLRIDENNITVVYGDTHLSTKSGALGFSQATVNLGNAIIDAAEKMKMKLIALAKRFLNLGDEDKIIFDHGNFYHAETGKLACEWRDFSDYCFYHVEDLRTTGRVVGELEQDSEYGVTPVACVADVEVDMETGKVSVIKLTQAHDTGRVIHQESARGQMLGAAIMEMGVILYEESLMGDGGMGTKSFSEYTIPTSLDIPAENTVTFIENNPGIGCPFGAKGLGEHGMHSVGAAIGNAILDATDVLVTHIPITQENVLKAMHII